MLLTLLKTFATQLQKEEKLAGLSQLREPIHF